MALDGEGRSERARKAADARWRDHRRELDDAVFAAQIERAVTEPERLTESQRRALLASLTPKG